MTRSGRAIRFPATDVRVFNSRASAGVRGIRLGRDDAVVSMAILRHFDATAEERAAYLKMRRAMAGLGDDAEAEEEEGGHSSGGTLSSGGTPSLAESWGGGERRKWAVGIFLT